MATKKTTKKKATTKKTPAKKTDTKKKSTKRPPQKSTVPEKKAELLLPGEGEIDDALLNEAVIEINSIYVTKGLEMARAVGNYVVEKFFNRIGAVNDSSHHRPPLPPARLSVL